MNFSYKHIWTITWPVMMTLLMEQLLNITDAIFLGHVGTVELGASAIAGIYYMALYMIGFGFSIGLQVLIARRNGEKKYEECGQTFLHGLYFLLFLAFLIFTLSFRFSPYLLRTLITSDEVYPAVLRYIEWRNSGLFFAFPVLAFRAFFTGITQTRIFTFNSLILVSANILLNYLLIYGKGGFPALGISGAAIASSASEGISCLFFWIYFQIRTNRKKYNLKLQFNPSLFRHTLNLSVWSMLQSFISVAPWLLFFIAIEHLGQQQLAVANIIRSISTLFFIIVHAFALTTGSLVSNMLGSGEYEKIQQLCHKVIRLSYFTGIPCLLLTLLFSSHIIGIYTQNPDLMAQAISPLLVMLSNYFIAVPAYVYNNAVTGTGNTRIAFTFQGMTILIYLLYLGFISVCLQVPLAVYWTTEQLYVIVMFLFSWFYLKKGNWQKRKI